MDQQPAAEETVAKPPYLSFQTFWGFLDELGKKPLPPSIDRTMMKSKSGTDQANLTAALRAFGLTKNDQSVEPLLDSFHSADGDGRKKVLAEIVRQFYADALSVSAENGSEKDLHDSFRSTFGLDTADTRRKAVTFFLHAASHSGIPLSPNFPSIRSAGAAGGTRRKQAARKSKVGVGPEPANGMTRRATTGETKVIDFGASGTVTIVVDVKWLSLPTDTMVDLRKAVDAFEKLGATTVLPEEEVGGENP